MTSPVLEIFVPSGAVNAKSWFGSAFWTGLEIKSIESVWCCGLKTLFAISILFLNSTPSSWAKNDVKLSTKKPDLNLLSPEESGMKRFDVLVSSRDSEV